MVVEESASADGPNAAQRLNWIDPWSLTHSAGPNELSVISPTAQTTILGPKSTCLKSGWYDYVKNQPLESLHAARDVQTHDARRRVWDRGFSIKGKALHLITLPPSDNMGSYA